MNVFTVLGVAPDATLDEIKGAYRERARQLHPDRHVRPDGSVPAEAQDAFVELNQAFKQAVAMRAIPIDAARQRRQGFVPQQRSRPTPMREDDPMLALLTLPQECREEWETDALTLWALTVVPAARKNLAEARRVALAAGARGSRQRTSATVHTLITLTVQELSQRRLGVLADWLDAAYDAADRWLPPTVLEQLPARVLPTRPGHLARLTGLLRL